MTTKEEYEKAIENIREAFYATTCPEWALEKFATNLDFISISIKEHFKEKSETNYEHFKDEIIENYLNILSVVKGTPKECYKTNCNDCDFKINQKGCRQMVKEWLKQTHTKPTYKLTQCEYDMLDTIFEKEDRFSKVYFIGELKKKGYFKNIKCDSNVRVKDILANCEVIK